jgi:hypothetical protein
VVLLNVAVNQAFAPGSLSYPSVNQKIGSYTLTAPNTQAVSLSSITIQPQPYGDAGLLNYQNLYITINSQQFGQTVGTTNNVANYTFTGNSPITIQSNGTATVDVYADIPALNPSKGILNLGPGSAVSGCGGYALTNNNALTCGTVIGQSVTFNPSTNPAPVTTSNLATSPTLNASLNSAFSSGTITQGSTGQKIGSYVLANSSAQAVSLSSLFFEVDSAIFGGQSLFQNVVVKLNGSQFGQTIGSLNSTGGSTFTATTPLMLPSNSTEIVDIYADIPVNPSAPGYINTATILVNCNGVTATASGGCGFVNGQSITLTGPATPSLGASLSNTSPASQSVVGGTTNQTIAVYNFNATSAGTINKMIFTVSGTGITSVTVGGQTAAVAGNSVTIVGLNLAVPSGVGQAASASLAVPITVNYAPVGVNGINPNSTVYITMTSVQYLSNGAAQTLSTNISSNTMTITTNGQATTSLAAGLSIASPISQSVVGGTINQPIATYNIAASGGNATISELDFSIIGSSNMPITAVTAGGSTGMVTGNTVIITGLSLPVPANYIGINIPVTADYASVGVNGVPAGQKFTLNLTGIKYFDSNSAAHTATFNIASNQMTLVASGQ